jgi:hypothetical protein
MYLWDNWNVEPQESDIRFTDSGDETRVPCGHMRAAFHNTDREEFFKLPKIRLPSLIKLWKMYNVNIHCT